MSTKIGYRVIFASSNENDHESEELEIRNNIDRGSIESNKIKNKGKGWQSARFCNYPQDLVVALDDSCEISQIQILSHQSKIASKVEIWVGLDNNNTHSYSTYKSINWKRLGYLSLDKNERSNWKARELKSVYINTTANYIKFSLHESHINTINLFNQIGIVALTVLGKQINHNNPQIIHDENNNNNVNIIHNDNNNNNNNSQDIDEYTAQKISELQILKKQAVENEDYDEAKRCKICIENLCHATKELLMLEKQKKIAVEKEDYDSAKALKLQIERLRTMSLNIENPNASTNIATYSQPMQMPPTQPMQPMQPAMNNHTYHPQQYTNVSYYTQPQQQPIIPRAMANGQPPQTQQQSQPQSHSQSMSPHIAMQRNRSLSLNPDERQIRPMKRNYNTVAIDASNENVKANPFGDDNIKMLENENENAMPSTEPETETEPNDGQRPRPPALKASVKNGSEKSIEMFGEHTICLLHSPNWNHRDEGLKKMMTFVNKREHPDGRQVFRLTAKTIHSMLQDRVAGVVLSAIDTLNALVNVYDGENDNSISGEECCKSLHSIIQILVNILGNNNNRLIDGSGSILISLCHHNELLCRSVFQVLVKRMKRILPGHLRGRGLILLQLIPQFNIPKGIDVHMMMDNLIQPQLLNKNGDIRDIGIQITCLIYQIGDIRNKIVHYLEKANLNDFIKESLNKAFKQVSGNCNVLEREAKSIKEQSRPSKTMNQTKPKANNRKPAPKKRKKKKITKKNVNMDDHNKQQQPQEPEPEPEEEEEDVCNFCGLRDISFIENEENLDLHYWQSCPMLTSCKLCEQVIEIATLHEHILTECESGVKHELCNKCNIPYEINDQHQCPDNINLSLPLCPLCLSNINSSQPEEWKLHLLKYPGCKSNPRPVLQ